MQKGIIQACCHRFFFFFLKRVRVRKSTKLLRNYMKNNRCDIIFRVITWRRNPLHRTIIARRARSELFSSPLPELDSALTARSLRDAEEKLVR